jgi:hypothetical protein
LLNCSVWRKSKALLRGEAVVGLPGDRIMEGTIPETDRSETDIVFSHRTADGPVEPRAGATSGWLRHWMCLDHKVSAAASDSNSVKMSGWFAFRNRTTLALSSSFLTYPRASVRFSMLSP